MKKVLSVVLMTALLGTMVLGLSGCKKDEVTPPTSTVTPSNPVETVEPTEPVEEEIAITMGNIVDTLKNLYGENYLPTMELDAATFEEMTGITSDMYTEFYGAVPAMSAHVDSLFIVKTTEDATGTPTMNSVETALLAYREKLVNDTLQYPMNQPKVAASTVVTYDDYVVFLMLGGYPEKDTIDGEITDVDTVKFCEEQTTAGVDALNELFTNGYVAVDSIEDANNNESNTTDTDASIEVVLPENPDVSGDVVVGEPEGSTPIDNAASVDSENTNGSAIIVPEKPVVNDTREKDVPTASDFE